MVTYKNPQGNNTCRSTYTSLFVIHREKKETDSNIRFHCPPHICTDRFLKINLRTRKQPWKAKLTPSFFQQFQTELLLHYENKSIICSKYG